MRHRSANLVAGGVRQHCPAAHLIANRYHGVMPNGRQRSPGLDSAARLEAALEFGAEGSGKEAVTLDDSVGTRHDAVPVVPRWPVR